MSPERNNLTMLFKTTIKQAFVMCLLLAMLALTTGCSAWTVCTSGTVVPAVKNFQFSLFPSGITWAQSELPLGIMNSYFYFPAPKHPLQNP